MAGTIFQGSLPPIALNTIWTHIESPADAKSLAGSPFVIKMIQDENDLVGLNPDDPGHMIACTGVPRGATPVVSVAQLKHPKVLSDDVRNLIGAGASFNDVEGHILDQIRTYNRPVTEIESSTSGTHFMRWHLGKYSYAIGIMEYLMGEGLFFFPNTAMSKMTGLVRYFADIADEVTSANLPSGLAGLESVRQSRVMSNLLHEIAALQDKKLAGGRAFDGAQVTEFADIQSLAVRKGILFMLGADKPRPSREDVLRGAAYLFDLMKRYEAVGAGLKSADVEALLDAPVFIEYSSRGPSAVLAGLDEEVHNAAADAKRGYFNAAGDVEASIKALYDFWDQRYVGAYLYREHIFLDLAGELVDRPEGELFRERANTDAIIAGALGLDKRQSEPRISHHLG